MEVKREDAASSSPSPPPPPPPHLPLPPPSTADEIFGLLKEEEEEEVVVVGFSVIEKVSPTSDGQTGKAQNAILDGKHQESSSKRPATQMKDEKSTFLSDPTELGYFGSSVHYGGRDFYDCSQSTATSKVTGAYTSYEEDDLDNSRFATRGNWWQGSLYY
ncbi:uncharacterized protein LOC109712007 isoform X1 [Ananas comosus]|uniref:Uncharacterized protein LOC109712007 isoform X1 n=1 Tax=Ananas comosus TaxID=4615 RepID=A0A6P5F5W4_ANACO|nr:uncharacterized protein LOC109712007 isoform X1 [Ananas comosus]XP_020091008.1 uncharacterized protein LOC109712007 isoform X1 [Ananas comosus]